MTTTTTTNRVPRQRLPLADDWCNLQNKWKAKMRRMRMADHGRGQFGSCVSSVDKNCAFLLSYIPTYLSCHLFHQILSSVAQWIV